MFRKLRVRITLAVLFAAVSWSVYAQFHLWRINEVYSNADGTVQFIELTTTFGSQELLSLTSITSTQGAATNSFSFPSNLPSTLGGTANKKFLIGTQGFAALGVVTPDYIVPNGFIFTSNVTINLMGAQIITFPSIPTDGMLSINGSNATAINSPTNFAGQSGMVVISNPTPPSPPTIGTATPGNAQATIAFTPGTAGSSPTTGFTATCTGGPAPISAMGGATSTSIIVPLTNGTLYSCSVTASNANGTSGSSGAVNVMPFAPVTTPGAPTINFITPNNGQATINFSPPASDGGGTLDFIANCGGAQAGGPSSPITVFGLANGTTYSCTVVAHNSAGNGPLSSSVNVTLPNVPNAPAITSATPGNAQATISFTTPFDGGSGITGYTATCNPGSISSPFGISPITLAGLVNGTIYSCTVTAFNGIGQSAPSAPASVTPRTVPGAPTIGAATAGNTTASIAFTPSANNGGNAVIDFTATCNPGAIARTNTVSPISFLAGTLTNGTVYTCSVTARNAAGSGAASATVSLVPATIPGAPTITSTIPGDGQASVIFSPPASNGGAAITSYAASCGGPVVIGSGSPITVTALANGVLVSCIVTATNAVGIGATSASADVTPSAASPLTPIAVYARKIHGALGPFDLKVNTTPGSVTTEPRFIGNGHTIVFAFNVPISDPGSATVTPVGMVAVDKSGYEVVTTLTGIPDNQRATITLTGVNGNVLTVTANLGFLVGDVNNSQTVNASDISGVKARSGQTTNLQNFKFDLNATGAINPADVSAVKARSGLVLPP